MPFQVFDFRKDIKNLLVTPQIRSRFLRMEVGQYNESHTHDLGHEIFLILQGLAEFEIEGHKEVVGPGQLCIALTDEGHAVRNVGDEPVIMYLSVTPHIQPTHTYWNDKGEKLPPRFRPNRNYDQPMDEESSTDALADAYLTALEALSERVSEALQVQRKQVEALKQAAEERESDRVRRERDEIWSTLLPLLAQVTEVGEVWNELASRTMDSENL